LTTEGLPKSYNTSQKPFYINLFNPMDETGLEPATSSMSTMDR
jgi:hypothetical protein